jgi:hypothetical protein
MRSPLRTAGQAPRVRNSMTWPLSCRLCDLGLRCVALLTARVHEPESKVMALDMPAKASDICAHEQFPPGGIEACQDVLTYASTLDGLDPHAHLMRPTSAIGLERSLARSPCLPDSGHCACSVSASVRAQHLDRVGPSASHPCRKPGRSNPSCSAREPAATRATNSAQALRKSRETGAPYDQACGVDQG